MISSVRQNGKIVKMTEILASIAIAIVVAGGIYTFLELRETFRANRDGPRAPASGLEALIGCKATVHSPFELAQDGHKLSGRVLIDGETWHAELEGHLDDAPGVGAQLEIVGIDPSKLRVSVK